MRIPRQYKTFKKMVVLAVTVTALILLNNIIFELGFFRAFDIRHKTIFPYSRHIVSQNRVSNFEHLLADELGRKQKRFSNKNFTDCTSSVITDKADMNEVLVHNNQSVNVLNNLENRKHVYYSFYQPIFNPANVNCNAIIANDLEEIRKAEKIMDEMPRQRIYPEDYINITADCNHFKTSRGYIQHPLSDMEKDFPLAFSIAIYTDIELAERLLRMIYRPHNYYCIHLDSKMKPAYREAFEKIVSCFENVFVTDTSLDVQWGDYTVLQVELLCMHALWRYKTWKYYINLTGQEFPLKTNREIVAILRSMTGANIVDGTWIRARDMYLDRWILAGKLPPHRILPIKGSIHVAINRQFVDFALHDNRSIDFLEWLKNTDIPDESFFSSLNHNPHLGINGSFLGEAEEYPMKPYFMRYKNWELGHSVYVRKCAGKYVRNICILGVGDIHKAYSDIGLFANKFNLGFEYLGLDCLEEVMYEQTWRQFINDEQIDTTYYSQLDYVKKKLSAPPI